MNNLQKIILFTGLFLLISNALSAQYVLQLSHISTGRKIKPIKEGSRVSYVLKNGAGKTKPITGILSDINLSTLTVNGVTFPISDIAAIGKKKSGSGFFTWLMSFGGGYIIGSSLTAENGQAPGFIIGGTLAAFGISTGVKNSLRNLNVWELEITD